MLGPEDPMATGHPSLPSSPFSAASPARLDDTRPLSVSYLPTNTHSA